MIQICLNFLTGEMLMELTTLLGLLNNSLLSSVDRVGPRQLLQYWLIELI